MGIYFPILNKHFLAGKLHRLQWIQWSAFTGPSHWVESLLILSQVCFFSHGGWLCWKLLPLLLIIESDIIFSSSILYRMLVRHEIWEWLFPIFWRICRFSSKEFSGVKSGPEEGYYLTTFLFPITAPSTFPASTMITFFLSSIFFMSQ